MSERGTLTVEDRLLRLENAVAALGNSLFRVGGTDRLRLRGHHSLANVIDDADTPAPPFASFTVNSEGVA